MGVSFPLTHAVLTQTLANPTTRTNGTVFYGVIVALNSLTYSVLCWLRRSQQTLLGLHVYNVALTAITQRRLFAMLGSAITTGIPFLSVDLSLAITRALRGECARLTLARRTLDRDGTISGTREPVIAARVINTWQGQHPIRFTCSVAAALGSARLSCEPIEVAVDR